MNNNAIPHCTVAAEELLEYKNVKIFSKVPGPKFHTWDFLRKCMTARHLPSATIPYMRLALQQE